MLESLVETSKTAASSPTRPPSTSSTRLSSTSGNEPGFEDHLYSEHVQAFEDEITAYLTAERDIRTFHVESVEQLDL
jgi:hypothetical protein